MEKEKNNNEKKNNKRKILIIFSVSILIIAFLVGTIFLFINPKNNFKDEDSKDNIYEAHLELIDNLDVEINSEINLFSFLKNRDDLEIISENEKVDTSVLGEKELIIKYRDNEEEKEFKFNINIKDTIAPTIEFTKEVTTTVGTEVELLKNVKVTDNSNEEIKATVEGEYDINKEGSYQLKYVAVDSSNNKKEEEFTLKVNKKSEKKTTTNNKTTSKNNASSSKPSTDKLPDNIKPSKDLVDLDFVEEKKEATDYKYGTKLVEVSNYFILKYSDNTTEKVYSGSSYKIDSKTYNGNTKALLSEATKIVDSNLSKQNEMLKYVNSYRAEKGAEPLTIDRNLSIAATVRALEIAYANKFSHTRPDGSDCYTIFDDLNIYASIKGENLTAGEGTVKEAALNWKNSSVHYANMINPSFTKIGIGIFTEKASEYYYYWVQLFSN